MVEGRIATRGFTDREGNDRAVTEIVVSGWQGMVNILGGKRAAESEPAAKPEAPEDGDMRDAPAMTRRLALSAALVAGDPAVVGRRLGAVLHRALRQPDLGRVLGVPVPHQHRSDLGSAASRACSTRRTRPRRSASAALRFPASASRLGCGSRRGWSTRRGRPGASPTSAASPSTPACTAGRGRTGCCRRRRRQGLGLACALLHVSPALLDRRAARSRLPGGWRARHRLGLGARSRLARRRAHLPAQPGSRAVRQPAGAGRVRCRLRGVLRRVCRSIPCSGARAARAGCIR